MKQVYNPVFVAKPCGLVSFDVIRSAQLESHRLKPDYAAQSTCLAEAVVESEVDRLFGSELAFNAQTFIPEGTEASQLFASGTAFNLGIRCVGELESIDTSFHRRLKSHIAMLALTSISYLEPLQPATNLEMDIELALVLGATRSSGMLVPVLGISNCSKVT